MGFLRVPPIEATQKEKQYQCEVSCGTCMFHMQGKGCKLAVKIKNTYYFVEGAGIDDFGDAHAVDGFCNAIKKAKVWGVIQNHIFVARKFEWLQKSNAEINETHKP